MTAIVQCLGIFTDYMWLLMLLVSTTIFHSHLLSLQPKILTIACPPLAKRVAFRGVTQAIEMLFECLLQRSELSSSKCKPLKINEAFLTPPFQHLNETQQY